MSYKITIRKSRPLYDRRFDKFIEIQPNQCYCTAERCKKVQQTHKPRHLGWRLYVGKWLLDICEMRDCLFDFDI